MVAAHENAEAGIFTREKRGVWAFYALVPALVPAAMDALSELLSTGGRAWT
jgi:hypothetical protein